MLARACYITILLLSVIDHIHSFPSWTYEVLPI
jgi:hypothetical protein